MHNLDILFGRSINTCFVFSSAFRSFVARKINFPSLSETKHQDLHVWIRYVNPPSCTWITSSLWSITPSLIRSSTFLGFIISMTLFLIKSNSSVRDCSESWQIFQVNGYVKYFQHQIGIICNKILLASSRIGLRDYFWDNKWKYHWLLPKLLEIVLNQIGVKLVLFIASGKGVCIPIGKMHFPFIII